MDKMTLAHDERGAFIFGGQKRNIYSKFLGRIKVKESEKAEKDIIFSNDEAKIFKKSFVTKYMKIADSEEACYDQPKQRVEEVLREQYNICSNVFSVFDQLQPIITQEIDAKIVQFFKQEVKSKYAYYKAVNELKNYKHLCHQIPHKVAFPMFSIICVGVKNKLIERIDALLNSVFVNLEAEIITQSQQIDKKHADIVKYMTKILNTAEDVQEMDKFTNNLILERSVVQDRIDEWRSNLFLLIDMDYNITEATQMYAKTIYQWPKKLTNILETAYRRHYEEREAIETQMYKRRDQFEVEMGRFIDLDIIKRMRFNGYK